MPRVSSRNLPYISEIWAKTDVRGKDAVVRLLETALTLPTAYVHAAPKRGNLAHWDGFCRISGLYAQFQRSDMAKLLCMRLLDV